MLEPHERAALRPLLGRRDRLGRSMLSVALIEQHGAGFDPISRISMCAGRLFTVADEGERDAA